MTDVTKPEQVSPELVERMVALCRCVAADQMHPRQDEARAIMADMQPVDPLAEAVEATLLGCEFTIEESAQTDAQTFLEELAKHGLTITREG